MILVEDDARASFFAMTSIIFTLCSSLLLCIFVPKFKASLRGDFNVKAAIRKSTIRAPPLEMSDSDYSSGQGSGIKIVSNQQFLSSENDKLKSEITELKRQIAEMAGSGQTEEKAPLVVPSSTTTFGTDPPAAV